MTEAHGGGAGGRWPLLRCDPVPLTPFHASEGNGTSTITSLRSSDPSLFFTRLPLHSPLVGIFCHGPPFLKILFFFRTRQKLRRELIYLAIIFQRFLGFVQTNQCRCRHEDVALPIWPGWAWGVASNGPCARSIWNFGHLGVICKWIGVQPSSLTCPSILQGQIGFLSGCLVINNLQNIYKWLLETKGPNTAGIWEGTVPRVQKLSGRFLLLSTRLFLLHPQSNPFSVSRPARWLEDGHPETWVCVTIGQSHAEDISSRSHVTISRGEAFWWTK